MLSLIRHTIHLPLMAYAINNNNSYCDPLVSGTILSRRTSKLCDSESNNFNSITYTQRYFLGIVNKIGIRGKLCDYCQGSGFLQCNFCISGCQCCDNSTLRFCLYCREKSPQVLI